MKKVLMWLDDNLEILLCGLLLTAITVVMSIQVIMRYLVGQALPWPEEPIQVLLYLDYLSFYWPYHSYRVLLPCNGNY